MTWRNASLHELFTVKHGYAFQGEFFDSAGEYVLLTPGNFREEGGFKDQIDKRKYYTGKVPDDFILKRDDLLVVMTEQSPGLLGSSAWISESGRFLHNQRLGLITRLNDLLIDKKFLYYLFNTVGVRHQISSSASGTKVRHTSPERIGRVTVALPLISVQRRIAAILSAYDDLIENNRRRIQLLEQAARLIYQEWFVRLRFPGHERVRVVDGVPEGWERVTMADICQALGGGTPDTKNPAYWDNGEITWVIPSDITKNNCLVILDSEKKITEAGLRNSSAKLLPPDTILMTSRASVGFFGLIDREVCTNQGFIAAIPNAEILRMYLLFNLLSRRDEILQNAKGTTYLEINKATFRRMPIIVPSDTVLDEFQTQASRLIRQVRLLKRQTEKLKRARDLLLPRLMSGQIEV